MLRKAPPALSSLDPYPRSSVRVTFVQSAMSRMTLICSTTTDPFAQAGAPGDNASRDSSGALPMGPKAEVEFDLNYFKDLPV